MKISKSFIPTLRQAPNDAEVISHKLLLRAGMIRKVTSGIYEWLPLGYRVLRKIENIVREEMNAAGSQEVHLPHMVPAELWQESSRWEKYGKELLRIKDRHERDYCFGPTHEEVICDMVRGEVNSYKQYPFNLYQIQTKFRDEIRPRFGLVRGREFLMKDAYSFHTTDEDLDREYENMFQTYMKIFNRCNLASKAVEADSGAIGGSSSHEFMVLAQTGEDAIASCKNCDYAANVEKATFKILPQKETPQSQPEKIHTPNLKSIEDVAKFLKVSKKEMIKSLIYKVDEEYVMVCLTGNREVSDIKLGNLFTNADEVRLASDSEISEILDLPVGFVGPKDINKDIKIIYDKSLQTTANGILGANEKDYHIKNVHLNSELNITEYQDVSVVLEKDPCPKCDSGALEILRGIEVGHIFKLGKRYSQPMKVTFLDKDGKEQTATMGTYGIGVSRTLAAAVEQNHDDFGIIWPKAIAPFDLQLMTMGPEENLQVVAEKLYTDFQNAGLSVLFDDRDERAGVKFKDADLIGNPLQIIIGKKSLANNEIEFKIRKTNEKGKLPLENVVAEVKKMIDNEII